MASSTSLEPAVDAPCTSTGKNRQLATAAMMIALVVSAFEGTVPTTAMPSIVRELGDVSLFSWVYTAFLMGSATAIPLFGKLADRAGRRPAFAAGMFLFLLGSVLCGSSTSMHQLIAYRAVQGFGAGAIGPLIPTVISDLYSLEARAKVQGLFTGAWGVANAIGPLAGGLIVSYTSWRWVFLINVPLGCAAAALLLVARIDPRTRERGATNIDVGGALLFALTAASLLLAIDVDAPLSRAWRFGTFGLTTVAFVALAQNQKMSKSPLLPLATLRNEIVKRGSVGSLFAGALMYAIPAYVPLWFASERKESAIASGLALVPFLLSWAAGGMMAVRTMVRRGAMTVAARGAAIAVAGSALLATVAAAGGSKGIVFAALVITGVGVGHLGSATQIGPQMAVDWSSRGAVTAMSQVGRTLGGAAAVAILAIAHTASLRFALLAAITCTGAYLVRSTCRAPRVTSVF